MKSLFPIAGIFAASMLAHTLLIGPLDYVSFLTGVIAVNLCRLWEVYSS